MNICAIARQIGCLLFIACAGALHAQDGQISDHLAALRAALSAASITKASVVRPAKQLSASTPDCLSDSRAEADSALASDDSAPAEPVKLSNDQKLDLHDRYDEQTRKILLLASGPLGADDVQKLKAAVQRLSRFVGLLTKISSCTDAALQQKLVAQAMNLAPHP